MWFCQTAHFFLTAFFLPAQKLQTVFTGYISDTQGSGLFCSCVEQLDVLVVVTQKNIFIKTKNFHEIEEIE